MCRRLERVSGEWIGTVRRAKLRGYVKKGATVKERYIGKYGIGVRIKSHLDGSQYHETIRTVQDDKQWFNVTFERDHINQPAERNTISVLNIVKKNDGYYCDWGDGVSVFFPNDWRLVESDVWGVLGV